MADSTEIRQLLLQINANTELLRSNLSQAEQAVKSFHEGTQSHLDQMDKRWAGFGKSIEALHAPLEKLKSLGELAVGALLGESLIRKGKEALEFAGNIQFMANQVGVSTDFLQKFNYAAGQFGVANDVADTALTRFTRTIGQAANGNKEAIGLFDRLGVKIRDQAGNVRSAEEIYRDFADGLKKIDNPAQRVTDTMQAMGRGAAALTPLVADGAAGFNDLAKAAEQLGIVLSPDLIEHSEEVNHKLAAMRQIVDAQMASVIASNAIAIESLADALIKVAAATAKYLNSHPDQAAGFLGAAAGYLLRGPAAAGPGYIAGRFVEHNLAQKAADENPDPAFRLQQYRAVRTQYVQAKDQQANVASGKLPYFLAPTHEELSSLAAEVHRQADLLRQTIASPRKPAAGQGSTSAGATNNNGDDLKKAQDELADLTKAKTGATGAALAAINDEIAQQKRYVGFLKQGLTSEEAKTLASKEGTELTKAETTARRAAAKAEQERRKALEADAAYHQEELRLQKSILEGMRSSATTDVLRDDLQKRIVNEEADTLAQQIKDRAGRGGYSLDAKENTARAKHLLDLNEQNRQQGVLNVERARKVQIQTDATNKAALSLQGDIDLLALDDRLALTRADRLKLELRMLDLQEQLAKAAQQAVIDSNDPKVTQAQRDDAATRIKQIDAAHAGNVTLLQRQNADPLQSYGLQLKSAVGDMNDAFKGVEADGLKSLEDGFVGVISGTKSVASAFKDMAASILADLARIAIEKAIINTIGGSFLGLKDGGEVPGFAAGGLTGLLHGPGGPRSDSMLIRASTGEFITNAASTQRYLPLLKAINDNRLPAFADGGTIGNIRSPSIPSGITRDGGERGAININVDARGATNPEHVRQIARQAVFEAAPLLVAAAQGQTMSYIRTPKLPGSVG